MSATKLHPLPSPSVPQYKIGDLVWCTEGGKKAQLRWPAMVAYDPNLAIYFRTQRQGGAPTSYHVQYFGVQAVRGWVTVGNVEELKEVGPKEALLEGVAKSKQEEYGVALEEVGGALGLTHKERKLRFIFNYDPPGTKRRHRRSTPFQSHKKKSRSSSRATPTNRATPSNKATPTNQPTRSNDAPFTPEDTTPLPPKDTTPLPPEDKGASVRSHKKSKCSRRGVVTPPSGRTHDCPHPPCSPGMTAACTGGEGEKAGADSNQCTPLLFPHRKSARIGMKRQREEEDKECDANGPREDALGGGSVGHTNGSGESVSPTNGPVDLTNGPVGLTNGPVGLTNGPVGLTNGPGGSIGPTNGPVGLTNGPGGSIGPTNGSVGLTNGPVGLTNGPGGSIGPTNGSVGLTNGPGDSVGLTNGSGESVGPTNGSGDSVGLTNGSGGSFGLTNGPGGSVGPTNGPELYSSPPKEGRRAAARSGSPSHLEEVGEMEADGPTTQCADIPAKLYSNMPTCDVSAIDCLPSVYLTPSSSSTEEELPRRDLGGSAQPLETKKRPSSAQCTLKDGTCSICDEEGAELLLCEGTCGSTFHLDCIGLVLPPKFGFVCDECLCFRRECFSCKGDRGVLHKCSRPSCPKVYHLSCVAANKLFAVGKKPGSFTCPLHVCARCKSVGCVRDGEEVLECRQCPLALHGDDCLVAGCEVVGPNQMVCYRHVRIDRDKNLYSHINIGTCLECGEPGSLYCCDFCSAAYHDGCLEKESRPSLEGGYWCCPNCVVHDLPAYGSMVICKHGRHRWWPAEVVSPDAVPENLSSKKPGPCMFVVKFYGSHDYCWTFHGRVLPYTTEGGAIGEGKMDRRAADFIKACTEALQAYPTKKPAALVTETIMQDKSYIRIKANKYLVPRPDIDFPSIPCQCTREHPCDDDFLCVNRALLTECDPDSCPVGDLCKNQRMLRCQYPETEIVHTGARGWGLKVLQDLKEGDFVIEYVGEILNMEMCQERLRQAHEGNRSNFYMFTLDHGLVIDAREKSNPARFINHSCDPNCHTQKWIVSGETRIGIFARQDIPAGTELTFDYQFDSLGNDKKKCYCGSAKCSGFLGLKKKEPPKSKKGPKVAKRPKAKPKRKSNRGGMCTDEEAKNYEDDCFVCRDGGTLVLCDEKGCTKVYHPSCIGRCKPPASGWICPHHFCDVCYARSTVLCSTCPVSFCELHREGKFVEVGEGKVMCRENCMAAEDEEEECGEEIGVVAAEMGDPCQSGVPPLDPGNERANGSVVHPHQNGLFVATYDGNNTSHKLGAVSAKVHVPENVQSYMLPQHLRFAQPFLNYTFSQQPLGHTLFQQPLDCTFSQQPLGHTLFQQPLGHTHFQQPLDHTLFQQPLGHTLSQQPLGHTLFQQSLGHTLSQQPLGHTLFQQPLGHTLSQQSLDHTLSQQSLGHTLSQQSLGHTLSQQSQDHTLSQQSQDHTLSQQSQGHTLSQQSQDHTLSQQSLDHTLSQQPVLCLMVSSLDCNHSSPHLKTSQQSSLSPPNVLNEEHPYVSLNCDSPIDSLPEDTQKKMVLSI